MSNYNKLNSNPPPLNKVLIFTDRNNVKSNQNNDKDQKFDQSTQKKKSSNNHAIQLIFRSLRQKKHQLMSQQSQTKSKIKTVIQYTKQLLNELQLKLYKQLDENNLKILQNIDNYMNMPKVELQKFKIQAEDLANFELDINIKKFNELDDQIKDLIYIKGYNCKDDSLNLKKKFSREDYQQIIQKLQNKLERTIINEQRLIELNQQIQSKMKKSVEKKETKPLELLFHQRYRKQNQILIQQINISNNKILELLSENHMLKDSNKILQEDLLIAQQNLKKSNNQVEKLQAKINMPDKKILEQNKNLYKKINQNEEKIQNLKKIIETDGERELQLNKLISNYKFNIDKDNHYIEQMENELKNRQNSNMETLNKLKSLQNLYNIISEEKDKLFKIVNEKCSKIEILEKQLKDKNQIIKNIQKSKQETQKYLQNQKVLNLQLSQRVQIIQKQNNLQFINIKNQIKQKNDLIKEYTFKFQVQQQQLDLLRKQSKYTKNIQNVEKDLQTAYKQIKMLNEELKQAFNQIKNLKSENQQIKQEAKLMKLDTKQKQTYMKKKQQLTKKFNEQKINLQNNYNLRLQMISKDLCMFKLQLNNLRQNQEYKKKLYEIRCKYMKEKFSTEIMILLDKNKTKKNDELIPVIQRLIQSFSNLIHKQSLIAKLKEEKEDLLRDLNNLKIKFKQSEDKKLIKKKINENTTVKKVQNENQIRQFNWEIQIQKIKSEKSIVQQKLKISEQKYLKIQSILKKSEIDAQQLNILNQRLIAEIKQYQRKKKTQKNLQGEIKSNAQILHNQFQDQIQDLEKQINRLNMINDQIRNQRQQLKEQVKMKKDQINNLRKDIKQQDQQLSKMKKNYEEQKQEHQKSKKQLKEWQRKQMVFKQNKQKLDILKNVEKQNNQLKKMIQEKSKSYKLQLSRKQSMIRFLKEKENSELKELKQSKMDITNNNQEEIQIKKLRADIDRKDSHIKLLNQKIEKLQDTLQREKKENEKKSLKQKFEFQKQVKKVEQLKLEVKKLDSENFMFRSLMKRFYRKLFQFKDKKEQSSKIQISQYSEGLSILKLNANDLKLFIPEIINECNDSQNNSQLRKFEKIFQQTEVDGGQVYQQLIRLIQKKFSNFKYTQ